MPLRSQPEQPVLSVGRSPRPGWLIAVWVGAKLSMLAIWWGGHILAARLVTPSTMQDTMLVFHCFLALVPEASVLVAWWLAMFVPHTRRSIGVPLALVAAAVALRSGVGITTAIRNFYSWSVFGQELWRLLAWTLAYTSLAMVCTGGICYLLSRLVNLQLIRSDGLPQPTTFDVSRIFGLTFMVAAAFAAVEWTGSFTPYLGEGIISKRFITAFAAISSVSVGVNCACLSWAYATGSKKWWLCAVAGLALFQLVLSFFNYWVMTRVYLLRDDQIAEPNYVLTVGFHAASLLGILIAIRVVHLGGYRLVLPSDGGN